MVAGGVIKDATGTIQKVSDDWFGIVPDYDKGTRFAPNDLGNEFKQDGLRIRFSGVIGEIPAGARMWGTPLRLTKIRRLEG